MTPEQRERVREIFLAACEKDPQERPAFLRRACQGDELVRREAESLLANDDEADAFLQTPALGKAFANANPESLIDGAAPSPGIGGEPGPDPDPHRHDSFPEHIGQYRILGILGKGGMGVVYRAEQENPRRPVALKVVRPGVESHDALRRFEREGQVLGKLQHPGIAQVFEAGTADTDLGPQPFFAMELVHGRPLTQYAQAGRLGLRARLDLIARVCSAVHHAHQKGVIHRDLKPGNILVDGRGHPKVVDFGVARATDADVRTATLQTAAGQLVGTIAYMSPEQIEGDPHDLDTRSDVYSLGVILYELLTGRLPVEVSAKTIPQAARAIVEQEPPSLSSVNRILRGDVETIAAKALQKDRERRYQSASSFADDIRRYLSDQPIAARPVTTIYQLRKFARRNKALVVSVAAVFVVLCVALVGVTVERNRALEAEVLAEKRRERAEHKAYAANIAAAHAALRANDVATAQQQLEAAPAPLRRWEWRYLVAQLDASLMTLHKCESKVWGVAFSPDSRWVGAAVRDGTIGIWDAETGRVHRMVTTGNANLMCMCFSPDGTRMVVGAETEHPLELWDTNTGERLTTLRGHTQTVWDVEYSADGALIASASLDGTARIWDANSGQQKAVFKHPSWVCCAAFNPDATRLVTNCRDNIARVWDLATSEPLLEITVAPRTSDWDYVHSWAVAFSPDAETLATGGHDGLIQIWDAAAGTLVQNIAGHTGRVRSLAYSPDGLHLASSSDDCTVRVWELARGVETVKLRGHGKSIHRVAFSPDGSRLATGSDDGTVRLWDPRANWRMTRLWGHKNDAINSIAITPDGSRLASVGGDAVMRLWSPMSGVGEKAMRGHESYIFDVAFSPDGKLAATASADYMVGLWDIAAGDNTAMLAGHNDWVMAVAFSPDGLHVASAGRDGAMRLWNAVTHSEVMTVRSGDGALTAIDFDPEGQVIATGSQAGSIELWDVGAGRRIRGAQEHEDAITRVVFSPDGKRLASASHDHTLKLWDTRTLGTTATLRGHTDVVSGAAFSPDGSRLASVSYDGNLHIWDVATGDAVISSRAHNEYVWDVAFSADGAWLATSAKSIRLWETERPSQGAVQQRLARMAAEDLVEGLSARLETTGEVIAHLEKQADIPDDVRQLAIQTAEFRKP